MDGTYEERFKYWRSWWANTLPGLSPGELDRRARYGAMRRPQRAPAPTFRDEAWFKAMPAHLQAEYGRPFQPTEEAGGRPPGKASPPATIPPPSHRRKKPGEERTPEEIERDEQWARGIRQGLMTLGMGGVGGMAQPGVGVTRRLPLPRALLEKFTPPKVAMTTAQEVEWARLLQKGMQSMKDVPWYETLPSGQEVLAMSAAVLAQEPKRFFKDVSRYKDEWLKWLREYWERARAEGGGGGAG